jgi:hypothetical protein
MHQPVCYLIYAFYTPPATPPIHPEPPTTCALTYHWPDLSPNYGIYSLAFPYSTVYLQPLKMELTHRSETSAQYILTPGKYPKEHLQYSNHGESLKSTIL